MSYRVAAGMAGQSVAAPAIALLSILAGYWFVLTSLGRQWLDDPNYTHGLFVVPMAAWLTMRRRQALQAHPATPSAFGVVVILAGALMYIVGIAAAELFTMRLALVTTVGGAVLLFQGIRRTRVLIFPLLFLLLMIPLPYVIYYRLTFPLQLQSSALCAAFLSLAGMPLVREGNVIHLEHYALEVVTACSGLRSIMTLGTMAVFLGDFLRIGVFQRLLLVLVVVPVAIAANTTRLITTAGLSAISGPETADGFLHGLSGVVVFAVGVVALLLIGKGFEWLHARRSSRG